MDATQDRLSLLATTQARVVDGRLLLMPPPVTARDVPLLILSTASSSERRITPSWSIALLKSKLEPVTGIPPSAQKLTLRLPERQETSAVEADDEEAVQIGQWPLVPYAELKVRNGADQVHCVSCFPYSKWRSLASTSQILFACSGHA